jgi:hypothetical protein
MFPSTFARLAAVFALLFLTSFSPWAVSVASTPTPLRQLDLVTRLGGDMTSVAVRGSLAYIGQGWTFTVLDISNPQQITPKGTLAIPDQVNQIRLAGSLALLGTGGNGMLIIDISDPAHPWFRERFPFGVTVEDLAVEGHLGYYVSGDLIILDLSNPDHIPLLSYWSGPGSGYTSVAVANGMAYLGFPGGLDILDTSNPAAPSFLGRIQGLCPRTPLQNGSMQVTGSRVYYMYSCMEKLGPYEIAMDFAGVFDVSDPANPQVLGSVGLGASIAPRPFHLQANGNLVYTTCSNCLAVIDFSSPANPVVTKYSGNPYNSFDFQAVDNLIYLASGDTGLVIVDLSAPSNPTILGAYDVGTGVNDEVQARPPYLYTTGGKYQLQVIDISSPKTPVLKKAISAGGSTLVVSGNLAYLNHNGLNIWDLSNPIDPVLKGSYPYPSFDALAILGGYAYVGEIGIGILDIHDPSQPASLGSTMTDLQYVLDMQTAGNLVYTAAGNAGLVILDATDVLNPQIVGQYIYKFAWATGVTLSGNLAYVTDGSYDIQGLLILDVQDPAHPSLVSQFSIPGSDFHQVKVIDHLAYIADAQHGLLILDVSDPAHPQLFQRYDLTGGATGLDVVGEYIYVSSRSSGVYVFRLWNTTQLFLPVIGG